jgi:hypothetical protein
MQSSSSLFGALSDFEWEEGYRIVDPKAVRSRIDRLLRRRQELFIQTLKARKNKFIDDISNPQFVKKRDKIGFFLGVINTCVVAFLLGGYPHWMLLWYVIWAALLIGTRFVFYHMEKNHYFLLDFCYLANCAFMFYIVFLPTSGALFIMCFALANGPLLWSIPAWNNALVFHDLNKLTSVFVHSLPPIVSYCIRWNIRGGYLRVPSTISIFWTYVGVILFFLYWLAGYVIKTELVDRRVLEKDPELVTSFRYFSTAGQRTYVSGLLLKVRPELRKPFFFFMQLVYTMVTLVLIPIMYANQVAHICIMVFILSISVWNGANYYIERFSQSYMKKLNALTKQIEQEME